MNKSSRATMRGLDCVRHNAIPETVLRRITARTLEKRTQELVDRDVYDAPVSKRLYWSNWYGPDIIRGPDGEFYVVEDNVGYVGGFGDLAIARQVLFGEVHGTKDFPELKPVIKGEFSEKLYDELAEHYHRQVAEG